MKILVIFNFLPILALGSLLGRSKNLKCDYCQVEMLIGNAASDNTYCLYGANDPPGPSCTSEIYKTGLDEEEKRTAIDTHNELRRKVAKGQETHLPKKAANMRKLVWNDELADGAQRWANRCIFEHDSVATCAYNHIGQNLYISYSTNGASNPEGVWDQVVKVWYGEVEDYHGDPEAFDGYRNPHHATRAVTGHFTQLIWAETFEIGCGYITHKSDNYVAKYYVCNYGPSGNMLGASMFQVGDSCSKCPQGTTCDDGLCA